MTSPRRPIGYWLKRLDRGLEAGLEHDLGGWELTRRHWQALHTVSSGPLGYAAIDRALEPFWTDGAIGLDEMLGELTGRGWVEQADGSLRLTAAGAAAHAEIFTRIGATRARITDGLSEQDYATALRVLERMTRNAEAIPAAG